MSTKGETLFHPVNGNQEETWDGFSWPAFFFGIFWMLIKGLYAQAVISFLIAIVTFGFGVPVLWIVYGFMGNGLHKKSLLKKGYLSQGQYEQTRNVGGSAAASRISKQNSTDLLERLGVLAKLKDSGALTQEEFDSEKKKILSA